MTLKTNLHNVLKSLRKERGVTQTEVAKALKITQKTYSNYENGTRKPDIEMLLDIANYYKVSTDVLLGRYN